MIYKEHEKYIGKGWVALRRTLPPWCWKENLEELLECCPRYGIDEVIVKVDTEEFSHGLLPVERLKNYQPALFEIKQRLNDIGVVFSINPWVTLVHTDRGRNSDKDFPDFTFMVGHDGSQCHDCVCPLSSTWRNYMTELWGIYAETEPDTIWVEDDIRTFNHYPINFGCFCAEHLKLFSGKVGRNVSREELVSNILRPGKPHAFRKVWLDMQGEIMIEVASCLEKAVHNASPLTKIGLMSSGPQNHCVEGRKWHVFSKTLSGNTIPVSRPPLGNYSENRLTGLYYTANSIRLTRHVLPTNTVELAEVENYPYSQYNKSNCFTGLQTLLCFALGVHGVAANLFDHCGTPMREDESTLQSLKKLKPLFKSISEKCCSSKGIFRGIGILHRDQYAYNKHLDEHSDYSALIEQSFGWENLLQACGFATTYDPAEVVALSGQVVRSLEQKDILQFLSKGVLCDLSAALTLVDMGYGEYLGVVPERKFKREDLPVAAEHFYNSDFGGRKNHFFALTIFPSDTDFAFLSLRKEAIEVSEIVDPDRKRICPGLILYNNSLGGRIAIWPININPLSFNILAKPMRQVQIFNILKWLSKDTIPLMVKGGHNTLPVRIDFDDRIIIILFCLSLDSWTHTEFNLHFAAGRQITRSLKLDSSGQWFPINSIKIEENKLILIDDEEITHQKPLIIELELKNN